VEEEQVDLRALQEEQSQLRSLLNHPGFKLLREFLQAQAKARTESVILTPLNSMDEVPKREYEKGEAAGIIFAEHFVDIRLSDLAETIEDMLEKKESDNAHNDEPGE